MAKTKTAKKPAFEDRIRFNWGYHDGANDAQRGHARWLVTSGEQTTKQVSRTFDAAFYEGYAAGLEAQRTGNYAQTSDAAWETFKVGHRTAGVDTAYTG